MLANLLYNTNMRSKRAWEARRIRLFLSPNCAWCSSWVFLLTFFIFVRHFDDFRDFCAFIFVDKSNKSWYSINSHKHIFD